MTKVKICGITNLEDALLSAKFGADALGFNFFEKSPRYITPEKAGEIIEKLPPEIFKVGVFVNESLEKIAEISKIAGLDALQLHGEETPEFVQELKAKTNLEIIKAFRVSPEFKPADVLKYETDAILLDAYNPKEHGGTGETFDWEIAKKVQEISSKMYLAGGLSTKNIISAVGEVKPYGIDACSGIESEKGKKDETELTNFLVLIKNYAPLKISNCYELLDLIQRHPRIYLGKYSISLLFMFLLGVEFGTRHLNTGKSDFDWKQFKPRLEPHYAYGFQGWISKKLLNQEVSAYTWAHIILKKCNGDEEEALNLFFALLEKFKLEKEDLGKG